jgi:glycosyltransferase involved in cell wall biosynthesis
MKFVVEALGLTDGGAKTGLLRLLPLLAQRRAHDFVFLLPDQPEYTELDAACAKVVLCRKSRSLPRRYLHLNRSIPALCAQERADALLCFGNFVPRWLPVPTVVVVHNAYYVYCEPNAEARATLREKIIIHYGRHHLRHLRADVHVIVQTEVMKRRILTLKLRQPEQVTVIGDRDPLPGEWVRRSSQRPDDVRPSNFICPAHYGPHKNLEILVDAVKKLPSHSERPARCLITVDPDRHPGARRLIRRIEREKLQQVLVNLGTLRGQQLETAYRSADAFVMPTLLESFGRTYHEAMQFGLPILTSDRDFARHVCQDAALYFDPLDADSVARTMARVMEDGNLRASLAQNGKRVINNSPTWDEIAAQFVSVLEEAAGCLSPKRKALG